MKLSNRGENQSNRTLALTFEQANNIYIERYFLNGI